MGWPLAVSAALMDKSPRALFAALAALGAGHLLASLLVFLPFAFLIALAEWQRPIQAAAALLVIGFGIFLFFSRHPRTLARIPPTQLALWSFAVAIAHGAGLMLVPIYLGLCGTRASGDEMASPLVVANLAMAAAVAVVHVTAMIAAGGCLAWLAYRYFGLRLVSRSWFNLDAIWAASLVLVGVVALAVNLVTWR